jgi:hypothetical protein
MACAISGMCSVARDQPLGPLEPKRGRSLRETPSRKWRVYSASDFFSATALRMIVSSTSVMFIT